MTNFIISINLIISGIILLITSTGLMRISKNSECLAKYRVLMIICGLFCVSSGLFIFTPIDNNKSDKQSEWSITEKNEIKEIIRANSKPLQEINFDTANLILDCFINKYTLKYSKDDAWEQEKAHSEGRSVISPLMDSCLNSFLMKNRANKP